MLGLIWTVLYNLLISLPNLLFYGTIKLVRRIIYRLQGCTSIIPESRNQDVIVLIHGRGGHPIDFHSLIDQLNPHIKEKYNIFNIHLGDTRNTRIDEDVESLSSQLEFLHNCRITLIGHSKGGIIACRYLALTEDPRIRKIITVSSPLLGTRVADCAKHIENFTSKIPNLLGDLKILSTDLNYNNSALVETAEKLRDHANKLYHVVAEKDHLIIPSKVAYYQYVHHSHIYSYTGMYNHCCLFDDSKIVSIIQRWLGDL